MNGQSRQGTPDDEITDVGIDAFAATMKFVANHDLWDEARKYLADDGVTAIPVGSVGIRTFKRLVAEELLGNDRVQGRSAEQASMIAECGCAHGSQGSKGAEFPTTTTDAGTDAGTPQ